MTNGSQEDTVQNEYGRIHGRVVFYANMAYSLRWDHNHGPVLGVLQPFMDWESGLSSMPDLFPKLRTFHFIETRPSCFPFVKIFNRGHLVDLRVIYDLWCEIEEDFLDRMNYASDLIHYLTNADVSPHSLTIRISGIVVDALQANHALSCTQFIGNTREFVSQRGSTLTSLDVTVGSQGPVFQLLPPCLTISQNLTTLSFELHDPDLPVVPLTFQSLQSLSVSFVTPSQRCAPFMSSLSCPRLQHLELAFGISGTMADHYQHGTDETASYWDMPSTIYSQGICESDYFHTITSFSLKYHTPVLLPDPVNHEFWDGIQARFHQRGRYAENTFIRGILHRPFPSLTSLSLETVRAEMQKGDLIELLTRAYPHLQELSMQRSSHYFNRASFSYFYFPDVVDLVSRLPELHTLSVKCEEVWGMRHREYPKMKDHWKCCPSLRRWNIQDTLLAWWMFDDCTEYKLKNLATHFTQAFPMLETVDFWSGKYGESQSQRWSTVNRYLHMHNDPSRSLKETIMDKLSAQIAL